MGFDDEYLNLKYAIRTHGPKWVHGHYVRKREEALDRGDKDEADHWEARRQSVGIYIDRRRFRYNIFSFSVGAVLALLPTGYVWIELQEFVYAIPTFMIITVILYLAIRFITNFVAWASGAFLWVAFGSLGWQVYAWLPTSKSGQPRMVTCTATMKDILERQRGRQVDGDDRVFPVSAMTLRRKWEKARKEAGLEDVTVHDLRRTHSTHSAAAGVDLRTIAGRMGHTDLSMLHKHYAALVGDAESEAAIKIEAVFEKMFGPKEARS